MAGKKSKNNDKYIWQKGTVVWDKPVKKPAPKKPKKGR